MRLIVSSCLIVALIAIVTFGEAQHYQHLNSPYVFPGYPMMNRQQQDSRFFFGGLFTTFTYTVSTTTVTATATTVTTCTTSSTTISTCTAGRRRRDELGVRNPRGLLYEEKEEDAEDGNVSLASHASEAEAIRSPRQMEVQPAIPYAIQPTFGAYYTPELGYNNIHSAVPLSRIFLAFGTATVTVTSTSTSTSKLIATCSSTTGFSTCTS
ncbi:uncharacterized protein LOC116915945 [Daphnia magna]|nr:uncharacterized protein LOC116915945 [Daphnia magna]